VYIYLNHERRDKVDFLTESILTCSRLHHSTHRHLVLELILSFLPNHTYINNDNGRNAHYLGWSSSSRNSYRGLVGGTKGEESSVRL
jgi:hypothetical protein